MDTIGDAFARLMEAIGVHWAAVTDDTARREMVLQLLAQVPVLWVWDNVEPVTGFPAGSPSAWTDAEQRELVDFLRDVAARTRCRVLLTSRRDERGWLGDLPMRVRLPGMPMRERLQLISALAGRHSGAAEVSDVDWRPLLRYTGGNPLTIMVAVGQALREQVASSEQLERFVDRVRSGETPLESVDDEALGRDRSLAASLGYGFTAAFDDTERAQLAVLHLFRDTVDVDVLRAMGAPEIAGADAVPALTGMTRKAGIGRLGQAAEVGLLTPHRDGYYGIHPALPWYFTALFTHHHGAPFSPGVAAVERAYSRTFGFFGNHYHREVGKGHVTDIVPILAAEEANFLHALELARAHDLNTEGVGSLQGLYQLYFHTGRSTEWIRLVSRITPDYIDPATDQPLPGRENQGETIMWFRVQIAREARDWPTATRLQTALVDMDRRQAADTLAIPPHELDDEGRHHIRNLAVGLELLADVLVEADRCPGLRQSRWRRPLRRWRGDTPG